MIEEIKEIGRNAYTYMRSSINTPKFQVEVKILDIKYSYGNKRYLVTPIKGSGEGWVEKIILK